jgi:hypothetical protein
LFPLQESARQFLLVQFGLCTFHYDPRTDTYTNQAIQALSLVNSEIKKRFQIFVVVFLLTGIAVFFEVFAVHQ